MSLFAVSVESRFRASHQVWSVEGLVEPEHQHDWQVTATVCSRKLDGRGMVMDFRRLKQLLDEVVAGLDGVSLSDVGYFKRNSSSAEHVARYIYQMLEPKLGRGVRLDGVTVVEQPGCSAGFRKS